MMDICMHCKLHNSDAPAPCTGAPDSGAGLQERGVLRNVLARAACRAAALHLVGHFRRCNLGAQLSETLGCPASLHLSLV